jgi:hypothetical protein
MDPRLIMAAIGQNRKVMQEQLKKLQAFTPAGMTELSGDFSVGDLMASGVSAHLQGAMDAIRVINSVEETVRSLPLEQGSHNITPVEQVIEAEFKEIK